MRPLEKHRWTVWKENSMEEEENLESGLSREIWFSLVGHLLWCLWICVVNFFTCIMYAGLWKA